MITFTPAVIEKVKELLSEEDNPSLMLRVFVQGGGCSGFQYGFTFDEEKNEDDFDIDTDGVIILVDSLSMQYLANATVDYVTDIEGARFVINNPSASSTCGCGSSFSV